MTALRSSGETAPRGPGTFRRAVDRARWQLVLDEGRRQCAADMPALALGVLSRALTTGVSALGRRNVDESAPPLACRPDTIFLVASLTKPVVAMAALLLVERGQLMLNERVADLLPEFAGADRRAITVRHLLTHTSGLPDMLPNNRALRTSQAALDRFVEGTCGVTLDFPPGRGVQYQSMGFALLGTIIQRVSGVSCAEFVRHELFDPLGMHDTRLGIPTGDPRWGRFAEVRVPQEQANGLDWNWNSDYWRALGAPWGGLLSTVDDLLTFCRMILRQGRYGGRRIFAAETVESALSNQLVHLHDVPEADRRTRGWGFGWRFNWLAHNSCFSDLLSPHAVGHWGATGTLMWIDPQRAAAAVILSTQPLDLGSGPPLTRLSNLIAAAL